MTAPSSSPERRGSKPAPWWRVPLLWLLIALLGSVLVASVVTVWIARHAADQELEAAPPVIHIGPPRAPAAQRPDHD